MRRSETLQRLGLAGLALGLLAGCGGGDATGQAPLGASRGEQAINADRALLDPDDQTGGSDNTGTWGGVQMPNIGSAPRL